MSSEFKEVLKGLITAAENGNSGYSRQIVEDIVEDNITNIDVQQGDVFKLKYIWKIRRTI